MDGDAEGEGDRLTGQQEEDIGNSSHWRGQLKGMPHLNNNNNSTLINMNAIACVFTGETILHGLGHGAWE